MTNEFVCAGCGNEREVDSIPQPGITVYKPCATCGTVGLKRVAPPVERSLGTVRPEKTQ